MQDTNTSSANTIERSNIAKATKVVSIVFLAIFLVTISIFPIMHLFGVQPGINYENKLLTELPSIDQLITNYPNFSATYNNHFMDYFPFRSTFLELYSLFEYKVLQMSLLPNAVSLGHNDWLFYEDWNTRNSVNGSYMLSEQELQDVYDGLMHKYNTLKSLGKEYIVYMAAEKQMVYPEYDRLQSAEYTVCDQLRDYLAEKNCPIPIIYSKDYLVEKKSEENQLYYKYDTHWNLLGAHYGYQDVLTKAKQLLPEKQFSIVDDFELSYTPSSGDLAGMLFLTKYLVEQTPVPIYQYTPTYTSDGVTTKITSNTPSDLKVFIYGDSFAQANYWGACFAQSACETTILHNSNNFQVLLDNLGQSDIVIEECVQRVLTTLGRF